MSEELHAAIARLLLADFYGNGDEYDDPNGVNREFWAALAHLRELMVDNPAQLPDLALGDTPAAVPPSEEGPE